ncbi:MAG: hypothetical protein LBH17_00295 [Oscillospiraceae bacterium]|jgi:hypothetical protein|nr:hypothetical protein [Oscillospiraceae bacterium]
MNSKNGKVGFICVGALAALLAILALVSYAVGAAYEVEKPGETPEDARLYVVRDIGGRVTAFSADADIPAIETEIETSGLREYDRVLLRQGIEVTGYRELVGLLEDFSN